MFKSFYLLRAAAILTASLFAFDSHGGTPSFTVDTATRSPNPAFTTPLGPVVADFDQDGNPDVATADGTNSSLFISYGNENGGSSSSVTTTGPTGATYMTTADLLGNGLPDLIFVVGGGVTYYLNDGINLLASSVNLPLPDSSLMTAVTSVATGDFNGDGFQDIVAAGYGSDGVGGVVAKVAIYFSTVDGGNHFTGYGTPVVFTAGALVAGDMVRVAVGDVNGDGYPDVAITHTRAPADPTAADNAGGAVTVFFGDPNGILNSTPVLINQVEYSLTNHPVGITIGDVTQDGTNDVLTTGYSFVQDGGTTQVWSFVDVLKNNGDSATAPTFNAGNTFLFDTQDTTSYPGGDVKVADIDGDGVNDIVAVDALDSNVHVLRVGANLDPNNNFFDDATAVNAEPSLLAIADLNEDGQNDIVVAHADGNGLSALMNTTKTPASDVIGFNQNGYTEVANGNPFVITVTRTDGTIEANVSLSFQGTAVAGADYAVTDPLSTSLHFAAGSTQATISISGSSALGTTKTIIVNLGTPNGGATLGALSTTTITLNPNATGVGGAVQFEHAAYPTTPNGQSLYVNVTRTTGTSMPALDIPITVGGTAIPFNPKKPNAYCDYIMDVPAASVGKIHFNANDTNEQMVFSISFNSKLTTAKTVIVTLGVPVGGGSLGSPSAATITISSSGTGGGTTAAANALTVKPANAIKLGGAEKSAKYKAYGRNYSPWTFSTTQTLDKTAPGLALEVEIAVEPTPSTVPIESDWTTFAGGTMSLKGGKGTTWIATTDTLPVPITNNTVFFRTLTMATGATPSAGKAVGPIKVVPGPKLTLSAVQCPYALASDTNNLTAAQIKTHDSEGIFYRFYYGNVGNGAATDAMISIPIGTLVHFSTATPPHLTGQLTQLDRKGNPTTDAGLTLAVQYTFASLAPGASDYVDVVVDVLSANEFNSNPGHSTDSFGKKISLPISNIAIPSEKLQVDGNIPVAVIGSPLRMNLTAYTGNGGITTPGGLITYTLTAYNDAGFDMATPVINDLVPPGTSLEAVYDDDGTGNFIGSRVTSNPTLPLDHTTPTPGTHYKSAVVNGDSLQLIWTLDKIPAGKSRVVKFDVRALYDVPTEVTNPDGSFATAQIVNNEYNVFGTPPSGGSVPMFTNTTPIPPVTLNISDDPTLNPPILGLAKEAIGQGETQLPVNDPNPNVPPTMTEIATVAPPDGGSVNGVLTYNVRWLNGGGATAKNVVIHDFINGNISSNSASDAVNGVFLGKSSVTLTTVTASGTSVVAFPAGAMTLFDGAGAVIPDGSDSRMTRAINFNLFDLPPDVPATFDRYISYRVTASDGGSYKPDKVGAVIRTGDFYLTTDSLTFPIYAAPRETFAVVVKPVTLEISSPIGPLPVVPGFGPGIPAGYDFFYQVNFDNSGGIDASNVTIQCPLPAGVLFEGFYNTKGVLLDAGDPNIGKSGTLEYSVTGKIPAGAGGIFFVKAHLLADTLKAFPKALRNPAATFAFQPTIGGGYMKSSLGALTAGLKTDASIDKFVAVDSVTSNAAVLRVAQPLYAELWLAKKAPIAVLQGGSMTYTLFFGNSGNTPAQNVTVAIYVPDNTAVTGETPDGYSYSKKTHDATWSIGNLPANSAGSVTLTVLVNQDTGTILENSCVIDASNAPGAVAGKNATTVTPTNWQGQVHQWWNDLLGANHINLGAANSNPQVEGDISTITQDSHYTTIGNASVIFLKDGVFIIPLGGGNVVVGAPAGLVTGGNAMNNGDGDTLVTGVGSAINIPSIGTAGGGDILLTVQAVATNTDSSKAGNVLLAGSNLIEPDGVTLKNNDTGAAAGALPTGAGKVVSNDGGSIVATGAGNVVSNDGGSIVATGAGSVISNDGGSIVSHDGGSIVSHDGGSIVSHDGGSIVSHDGGSIVSAGAGNFIPQNGLVSHDGGSIVSEGGGQ